MSTFTEVTGFTPDGERKFSRFMLTHAAPEAKAAFCRAQCLAIVEICLNDDYPIKWELEKEHAKDGQPVFLELETSDLATLTHELD